MERPTAMAYVAHKATLMVDRVCTAMETIVRGVLVDSAASAHVV